MPGPSQALLRPARGRPCYHPRSCPACAARGQACGGHTTGNMGHGRCTGTPVQLPPCETAS